MTLGIDIEFPCRGVPDAPAAARLLGLYPQRQEGLWMQRVRVPGGCLSGAQWRALAEVARRHAPTEPLHLTTRQDVEIHGLRRESVPAAQAALAEAGLTTVGACGDTVRNVTVCPCSGAAPACPDLLPLAAELTRLLQSVPGALALPRKFKLSLSACGAGCGQPWINDLGLVAQRTDGAWGFRAIAAGSLGPRPGRGIALYACLPARDAAPLVLATLRVFAEHGDRAHRGKARLRHVRERVGNEAFANLVGEAFATARAERDWPNVHLHEPVRPLPHRATLTFADGDVTLEAAGGIADLADDPDLTVRIANQHRIVLFGPAQDVLARAIGGVEALRPAARARPSVVACPGSRWCARALVDTHPAAEAIRRALAGWCSPDAIVGISGCPNGCAHSAVADVGLSGCIATMPDGRRVEAFDVTAGGGMGRDGRLGRLVDRKVPADQAVAETVRLLKALGPAPDKAVGRD